MTDTGGISFSQPRSAQRLLGAGIIVLAVAVIAWPALRGAWIWDDLLEVTRNPSLHEPGGLGRAWFDPIGPDYYPVKTTLQWFEWKLFGDSTLGWHVVTAALHTLGALLVWRLLGRLGVRMAWVGGLVFAIHPLAVESFAWISEEKNTLSLPFLLGSALAYLRFESNRDSRRPGGLSYALSVFLFLTAMLSKSSVVMFPFTILLYSWWKRGRIRRGDLTASAPFFAVSLGLGLVTLWFQREVAISTDQIAIGGPLSRLACAGLSLGFYLVKACLPFGVMPIYPRWNVDPPSAVQFLPLLGLIILAVYLWSKRSTWGRPVLFALGYFVLNLLPVCGLIRISFMRMSWVSDHFAYVSLVAVAGLAAAGCGLVSDRLSQAGRPWAASGLGAVLLALLVVSRSYALVFSGPAALWSFAVLHNPASPAAQNNLALVLGQSPGHGDEAIEHFRAAIQAKPDYAEAHSNLALELEKRPERAPEALKELETAVRLEPQFAEGHNNLGNLLAMLPGRLDDAIVQFEEALRLEPGFAEAHNNLGLALSQIPGRAREAADHYQEALQIDPDYAAAHFNLAVLLSSDPNRSAEAIDQFEAALKLYPRSAEAHNDLGLLLAQIPGRTDDALSHYQAAILLRPNYAEAHNNMGNLLAQVPGRLGEAIGHYEKALEIDPNLVETHYNIALAYARLGRMNEAIPHLETAARLAPDNAQIRDTLQKALASRY